jgi:FolB domain-containing protein
MEDAICMNTPTDRIVDKDLMLRCVLGMSDEERGERQDVLINHVMWADLTPAAASDDIRHAVDYRALKKKIITLVENSQYHLGRSAG